MLYICKKAACFCTLSLSIFALLLAASGLSAGELYQKKLIKSRANRGYDAHGTAVYSYIEVDEYSDDLDPEEELGALDVEDGVREVHSVVIVNGEVSSELDNLQIGTVRSGPGGRLRTVTNNVSIDGDVSVTGGGTVNLGVVNMGSRQRGSRTINNRVKIDGSLQSE